MLSTWHAAPRCLSTASLRAAEALKFHCMTWNLHGKSLDHVHTLLDKLEQPSHVMFLQEVGDVRDAELGKHVEKLVQIAGKDFVGYVANPTLCHRCTVVLVACELEFKLHEVHVHDCGVSVRGCMLQRDRFLSSLHLPHAHRPDSLDTWRATLNQVHESLLLQRRAGEVLIGHDLNQDAHAHVDSFDGMMHYRQFVASAGLETSPPQGSTWIARGSESCIDFLLYKLTGAEVSFWKRPDLRVALPSDHNPVGATVLLRSVAPVRHRRPKQTLCGKWNLDAEELFAHLQDQDRWDQGCIAAAARQPGVASRPASLKYQDPPEIKELIERRKKIHDADARTALMQEIHLLRRQARQDHKSSLLERAKQGDWRAIAHLRRSAAGSFTDGSYIQRAGGLAQAARDLHDFYVRKYASSEAALTSQERQQLQDKHACAAVSPVTKQEVSEALARCRSGVSAGLDGVTFEGLRALVTRDDKDRIPHYFTRLLKGEAEIPELWLRGKIVFLPKVARPSGPGDLRPICLVPTLSRLYAKIVMERLRGFAPEYGANQLACRPGVQVLDGITAAQSAMTLVRKTTGSPCKVAKLDIKAAFDSVSHRAILRWLMECDPCAEAIQLAKLCFGTSVVVGVGGVERTLQLQRGIMQGSAFSADVFSRMMDWALKPQALEMERLFPVWSESIRGIPHFLIYADDLIVFADSEAALQTKVSMLVRALQGIGLEVNPSKCRVLHELGGETCPGVWLPATASPLKGEDQLVFLGVPVGHNVGASVILSHLLRKTNNTFFAFKRLLDDSGTSLALRLNLFDSFVTSKWQWAAPALFPDQKSLRQLESHKNTYLLSICRVGTDPLMHWVDNTISRRRAVRLMCLMANGPDWRKVWLKRFWTYHGHLARCKLQHPQRILLSVCSSANLTRGLRASWITDLPIRKLQRVYTKLLENDAMHQAAPGLWEVQAQDRKAWSGMLSAWLKYWIPPPKEPKADLDYLLHRQLVLLWQGKKLQQMYFRPAKDCLEQPYESACLSLREVGKRGEMKLLLSDSEDSLRVLIWLPGRNPAKQIVVHVVPVESTQLGKSLALLTLGLKLVCLLRMFGKGETKIVAAPALYHRDLFQENVPLSLMSDLSSFKQALQQAGEGCLCVRKKCAQLREPLGMATGSEQVAMPTKYLVRSCDFVQAHCARDFRQVHGAVWELLASSAPARR